MNHDAAPPTKKPRGDNHSPDGFLAELARIRHLTGKQHMVLRRLIGGQTHKDIAGALNIKPSTVNTHLKRIYEKFDVNDQTHLVLAVTELFRRLYPRGYRQG